MSAKPKPPLDEEAHFRIDEIERKLAAVPSVEHIAGIAGGAVSVMLEQIRAKLIEMESTSAADVKADREIIETNRDLHGKIGELIETLRRPTKRTVEIMLPSGPATMTIHETRE